MHKALRTYVILIKRFNPLWDASLKEITWLNIMSLGEVGGKVESIGKKPSLAVKVEESKGNSH